MNVILERGEYDKAVAPVYRNSYAEKEKEKENK